MMNRKEFIKLLGCALALPKLETFATKSPAKNSKHVFICQDLGYVKEQLYNAQNPLQTKGYYLDLIKDHQKDYTLIKGLHHPMVSGHGGRKCFLTGAKNPERAGFKNSISIDTVLASKQTNYRFPVLNLCVGGTKSLSMDHTGAQNQVLCKTDEAFKKLFVAHSAKEKQELMTRIEAGFSSLDTLNSQSRLYQKNLSKNDRSSLNKYFNSIRELEVILQKEKYWLHQPKPKVAMTNPGRVEDYFDKIKTYYKIIALALETKSTDIAVMNIISTAITQLRVGDEIYAGYHNLSHHGRAEKKLKALIAIERKHFQLFNEFLHDLKSRKLLSSTQVIFSSNLENASNHKADNLPVLLAGGNYQHQQFLNAKKQPLSNLYLRMLQDKGINHKSFSNSTEIFRHL
ncbi:MAG: DUF1552 domain-containing protein [Lentisphaerales bacterium]|nr:DUF1552 domain-containing protein [Lentisphaerales bacterium]